jgi:hypothetical protein
MRVSSLDLGERCARTQFSYSFYGLATHNTHIPSYPTCVVVASATETVTVYPSPLSRSPHGTRAAVTLLDSGGRLSLSSMNRPPSRSRSRSHPAQFDGGCTRGLSVRPSAPGTLCAAS